MGFYPFNNVEIDTIQTPGGRSIRVSTYDPIGHKYISEEFPQDMKGDDFGRRRALEAACAWLTKKMMILEM